MSGAKEKTNQYYKAAFDVLTEDQLLDLIELVERMTETLTPEEEAQPS